MSDLKIVLKSNIKGNQHEIKISNRLKYIKGIDLISFGWKNNHILTEYFFKISNEVIQPIKRDTEICYDGDRKKIKLDQNLDPKTFLLPDFKIFPFPHSEQYLFIETQSNNGSTCKNPEMPQSSKISRVKNLDFPSSKPIIEEDYNASTQDKDIIISPKKKSKKNDSIIVQRKFKIEDLEFPFKKKQLVNDSKEMDNKDSNLELTPKLKKLKKIKKISFSSPRSKVCVICLETIHQKTNLDSCCHQFCKDCIENWSNQTNLCPVCKKQFRTLTYTDQKNKKKGNENTKIVKKVKNKKLEISDDQIENWFECESNCMVCGKADDEPVLLVCDICQYRVCHTYCDNLFKIPDDDWECFDCRNESYTRKAVELQDSSFFSESDSDDKLSIKKKNSKGEYNLRSRNIRKNSYKEMYLNFNDTENQIQRKLKTGYHSKK